MHNLPSLSVRSFLNVEEELDLGADNELFRWELDWTDEEWNGLLSGGADVRTMSVHYHSSL